MPNATVFGVNERRKLQGILAANVDKDFVKRLLVPEAYGKIDRPELGNPLKKGRTNAVSTHLMAGADSIVYPEIIDEGKGVRMLGRKEALDHAVDTGQYIQLNSEREANWFGKNYKKALDPKVFGGKR